MNLVSGAPFWLLRNGLEAPPRLPLADCDIVVVGAGLTGALLADSLTAAGYTVTVLDRRAPGEGSSAACTGLLTYELDVDLVELAAAIGEQRAARAFQVCAEGIEIFAALVSTLPDDCGFVRRNGLYLGVRRRDRLGLMREAAMRERHGLEVEYWPRERARSEYGFACAAALRVRNAAVIDPVRLTRALLRRATDAGAVVCSRTRMLEWSADAAGVTVTTDRGSVRADRIVLATGYELPDGLRERIVDLNSSYALVTAPVDTFGPWTDECIIWETRRPYHYLRTTHDGRIMIGGADVSFRNPLLRDRLLPGKTRALERRLHELLPDVHTETDAVWAGTFGETPDGLPYIGAYPGLPRALFALGYGGNGIVFSVIASRILRDMCLGEGHADAPLFAFDR